MNETAKPKPLSLLIAEHEAAAQAAEDADRAAADARSVEQAAARAVLVSAGIHDVEAARQPRRLVVYRGKLCEVLNYSGHRGPRHAYALEPVAFAD